MKLPHWALLLAGGIILYMLFFHAKQAGGVALAGDMVNKVKSQMADNPATQWIAKTNY
jgi:hypothetical protein